MSAQLKEKALRIREFLTWLEAKHGASLPECQRWFMVQYRLSRLTIQQYLEDLKFTREIWHGKDGKIHSREEQPL